ncbi:MAG TPA: hypothetical protein VGD98_18150 [Ktedonobacteraceae bacterium]
MSNRVLTRDIPKQADRPLQLLVSVCGWQAGAEAGEPRGEK